MKTGRNLNEVMAELSRQSKAKKDFIGPAEAFHLRDDGRTFEINHVVSKEQEVFGTTQLFVGQRIERDANGKLFFRFSNNRPRSLEANGRLTAIIRHILGEY